MSASRSTYIEAPVEKVFDWFKDPRNWIALDPEVQDREAITAAHVTRERRASSTAGR